MDGWMLKINKENTPEREHTRAERNRLRLPPMDSAVKHQPDAAAAEAILDQSSSEKKKHQPDAAAAEAILEPFWSENPFWILRKRERTEQKIGGDESEQKKIGGDESEKKKKKIGVKNEEMMNRLWNAKTDIEFVLNALKERKKQKKNEDLLKSSIRDINIVFKRLITPAMKRRNQLAPMEEYDPELDYMDSGRSSSSED